MWWVIKIRILGDKDMNESKIERIKKCLTLAKGTTNEHEAESAMKMAQRLALSAGVDIDTIDLEDKKDDKVYEEELTQQTVTLPAWKGQLAYVIANNFKTKVIKSYKGERSFIVIIGKKEDIEITKEVINYAEACLNHFFKKFYNEEKKRWMREFGEKLTRTEAMSIRNTYVDGYLEGLKKAFKKNVEEYQLMVVTPTDVVEYYDGLKLKSAPADKRVRAKDTDAYNAGFEDGKSVGTRNRLADNKE